MDTLKPQSNGPLYSNTVIDMVAECWLLHFGTARRGLGGAAARRPSSLYQNVTAHLSTVSVPTSHYPMWHYYYMYVLKG